MKHSSSSEYSPLKSAAHCKVCEKSRNLSARLTTVKLFAEKQSAINSCRLSSQAFDANRLAWWSSPLK